MVCAEPGKLCVDCVANGAAQAAIEPTPCPVCGKRPAVVEFDQGVVVRLGGFGDFLSAVWCAMQDGGCGLTVLGSSREEVIDAWNSAQSEAGSSHRERGTIVFGWPPKP
jgi:hypothetical protein